MSAEEDAAAVDSIDRLSERIQGGGTWIERRDTADALTLAARRVILSMRGGAIDPDPDVAHACSKAIELFEADLKDTIGTIQHKVDAHERAFRMRAQASGPTGATTTQERTTVVPSVATREEAIKWLQELALEDKGELNGSGVRFSVRLPVGEGRWQTVYIELDQADKAGEPMVLIFTRCGVAEPRMYAKSLQINARLSHASFAMFKIEDKEEIILMSRRRLNILTRQSFAGDIRYIAGKGDKVEEQLHGSDDR